MCPRVIQFLMKPFSGTKAWLGCPFGCSSQCTEVSPIQLLAEDLPIMVGDFCIWKMNSISKAESQPWWAPALTDSAYDQDTHKGLECFACSLHYTAGERIPTFPGQMQKTALTAEIPTYCFFCLSLGEGLNLCDGWFGGTWFLGASPLPPPAWGQPSEGTQRIRRSRAAQCWCSQVSQRQYLTQNQLGRAFVNSLAFCT